MGKRQHHHWHTINGGSGPVANQIVNGTFAAGTTGWTGFGSNGKSVAGGVAVFAGTTGFDGIFQTGLSFQAGKYYGVRFTVTAYTSGSMRIDIENPVVAGAPAASATGNFSYGLLSAGGETIIQLLPVGGGTGDFTGSIDNVLCYGPFNSSAEAIAYVSALP